MTLLLLTPEDLERKHIREVDDRKRVGARAADITRSITLTTVFAMAHRYGFICYLNEADATQAVSTLNHSEIAGRQVNVELAKPAAAPRAPREPREPKAPAAPRAPKVVAAPVLGEDGEVIAPKPKKRSTRAVRSRNRIIFASKLTDNGV